MANFFPAKVPTAFKRLYPQRIWDIVPEKRERSSSVYFTFDDGPIPEVTPWVLATLASYDAKGTFFCIGDNLRKHPNIAKQIVAEGHSLGNHTQHHLSAWKHSKSSYIKDIEEASNYLRKHCIKDNLFRPPYGKLKSNYAREIQQMGYSIIMWDILSKDYEQSISKEACLENVINHLEPGSIVVFHDSLKAQEKLEYTLPRAIEFALEKGFSLDKLPSF